MGRRAQQILLDWRRHSKLQRRVQHAMQTLTIFELALSCSRSWETRLSDDFRSCYVIHTSTTKTRPRNDLDVDIEQVTAPYSNSMAMWDKNHDSAVSVCEPYRKAVNPLQMGGIVCRRLFDRSRFLPIESMRSSDQYSRQSPPLLLLLRLLLCTVLTLKSSFASYYHGGHVNLSDASSFRILTRGTYEIRVSKAMSFVRDVRRFPYNAR